MSGLNFQDFNVDLVGSSNSPFTSSNPNNQPPRQLNGVLFTDNIGDGSEANKNVKKPHFLTFGFYQQYFDIDTTQVQTRILHSFLPTRSVNFITDHIQPMPDLYGPFWICVTLIFSIAIFGNFARYIQSAIAPVGSYENDFQLVTSATTLIFCYVILVPFAIYSFMWHRKTLVQYSYIEMVCAYGYSLAIFVPVSMLWVVQLQWFRWSLIVVSVVASGAVLFGTFWPVVKADPNRFMALGFIAGIIFLHAILAVGFKELYFDQSMPATTNSVVPATNSVVPATTKVVTTTLYPTTKAVELNENKSRIVIRNVSLPPLGVAKIFENETTHIINSSNSTIHSTTDSTTDLTKLSNYVTNSSLTGFFTTVTEAAATNNNNVTSMDAGIIIDHIKYSTESDVL